MNTIKTTRPKFLNLLKIRMPVTAVVSILHRVSGIVLFFSIPVIIWLFSKSVINPQGFDSVKIILASGYGKGFSVILLWAITHHFFAGLRFLFLDLDVAISRSATLKMAWLVFFLVATTFAALVIKVVL